MIGVDPRLAWPSFYGMRSSCTGGNATPAAASSRGRPRQHRSSSQMPALTRLERPAAFRKKRHAQAVVHHARSRARISRPRPSAACLIRTGLERTSALANQPPCSPMPACRSKHPSNGP